MRIDGINVNPKVTEEVIMEACERQMTSLDNPGICLACGLENGCCEPDARKYKCEGCGEHAVYGAEELMIRIGL